MEHSAEKYLERLPTEKLTAFLGQFARGELKEDFSYAVSYVQAELKRREQEETPFRRGGVR